MQDLKVACSE